MCCFAIKIEKFRAWIKYSFPPNPSKIHSSALSHLEMSVLLRLFHHVDQDFQNILFFGQVIKKVRDSIYSRTKNTFVIIPYLNNSEMSIDLNVTKLNMIICLISRFIYLCIKRSTTVKCVSEWDVVFNIFKLYCIS